MSPEELQDTERMMLRDIKRRHTSGKPYAVLASNYVAVQLASQERATLLRNARKVKK